MKVRKHVTQMTEPEIVYCHTRAIMAATFLTVTQHAQDRYSDKHLYVSPAKIKWLVSSGTVIEFELVAKEKHTEYFGMHNIPVVIPTHVNERIVMRCAYDKLNDISIALDVTNNCVVTLWLNRKGDKHFTLNLSQYDEDLNVINP